MKINEEVFFYNIDCIERIITNKFKINGGIMKKLKRSENQYIRKRL